MHTSPSFKSELLLKVVNPLAPQGRYEGEKGITTLENSYSVFPGNHGFREKFFQLIYLDLDSRNLG